MELTCPNCHKKIYNIHPKIYRKNNKNILGYSCPYCSFMLKEEPIKYNQTQRILFIIFSAVVLFVISGIFLFALNTMFIDIWLSTAVLFFSSSLVMWLIYYFIKKNANLNITLKNTIETKQTITTNKQKDLIMRKILLDINKTLKQEIKTQNKKYKLIHLASVAIIIIFVFVTIFQKAKTIFNTHRQYQEDLKISLIEKKAGEIISSLDLYCYKNNNYPQEIPQDVSVPVFNKNSQKVEKYMEQIINTTDFQYKSTGEAFTLCINPQILNKCWHKICNTKK